MVTIKVFMPLHVSISTYSIIAKLSADIQNSFFLIEPYNPPKANTFSRPQTRNLSKPNASLTERLLRHAMHWKRQHFAHLYIQKENEKIYYHNPAAPVNHPYVNTVTVAIPNMKPSVCLSTELNAPLQVAQTQSESGVYG